MSTSPERARAALAAHKRRMWMDLVMLGLVGLLGLRVTTSGALPRGFGIALVVGSGLLAARTVRAYSTKSRDLAPPQAGAPDPSDTSSHRLMLIYLGILGAVAAFIYVMTILFAPSAR